MRLDRSSACCWHWCGRNPFWPNRRKSASTSSCGTTCPSREPRGQGCSNRCAVERWIQARQDVLKTSAGSLGRMTGVYLGLDIGTSSVKAVLVDAAGSVKVVASRALDVSHPKPLWSEQNPDSWVEATIGAVDELASTHPVAVAAVRGVGLSGQ